jgi:hypothetical protein
MHFVPKISHKAHAMCLMFGIKIFSAFIQKTNQDVWNKDFLVVTVTDSCQFFVLSTVNHTFKRGILKKVQLATSS